MCHLFAQLPEAATLLDSLARFWQLRDPAVRTALAGVLLLSLSCGTLGCFIVLRRLSLLGDSLGHAVLPGICAGFLITRTKDPRWIFLGSVLSALLASWMIGLIHGRSRVKPDTAMGLVLSGFFGIGTVLLTRIQKLPYGNQSGLDRFLFGQASAINEEDLVLIGLLTAVILGCVLLLFKEFTLISFDPGFAQAIGLPVRALHYLFLGLVALAIVVAIQAVGVVLLSALLITPAATAYLLTDRLPTMVLLSVLCAVFAGVAGLNISFLGRTLPTGPFIVLALTAAFAAAWLFSPRYGFVTQAVRRYRQSLQTGRENVLKSVLQAIETQPSGTTAAPATAPSESASLAIPLADLARFRDESPSLTRRQIIPLMRRRWAYLRGETVYLTEPGAARARELIRNYRLWEQFLTEEVNLPLDHTARDAEEIEHILGPDLVEKLENRRSEDQKIRGSED